MPKYLIVNADDLGLSPGVNRGIIECVELGLLTSASLMVRWPAAAEAAAYAKRNSAFSVGLHLDLGEWVLRNGEWEPLYHVVDTHDAFAVAREIENQLAEFRRLMGRDPSHLDSHQHAHRQEPARSLMLDLANDLDVPLREFSPPIHYCGDFYGQGAEGEHLSGAISVANLEIILSSLPAEIVELGCHPGYGDDLNSPYRVERAEEVRVLCDPAARRLLARLGIVLCTFETATELVKIT